MFGWFNNKKSSKTGRVMFTGNMNAKWTLGASKEVNNAKAFAEEGYQKNVVVYQAINKKAQAVSSIPCYVVNSKGETIPDHPLKKLLYKPNPLQSGAQFMQSLVGYYDLAGNAYIERVVVRGEPRELYALRPDRMTVIPSQTGVPSAYVYKVGQEKVTWKSNINTGLSDIRQLRTFNPLNDWYGMSPIMAGAFAVDQHNEGMQHIQSLLQNGASPSGAMEIDGELTDDQFNRLKAEIDEKYAGSKNAGRPMLLEGGMKWSQMGLSPADMEVIQTKYSAARDISLALAVPPLLLNIPGDSTYSNYKEARLAFYEETVIPLAQMIVDELNCWLSPMYGDVKIMLDLEKVPAIAEKRRELWAMADASTDLTVNERRKIKGYEETEGGDQVLVPSTLIPLDFASEPITLTSSVQQSSSMALDLKSLAYGKDGFTPPKGVQEAAQQGLDYRREYGRGGTEVGIARARDLSNGKSVSLETINRMVSFFARHADNAVPPSEKTMPDGGPTNGWIAWQLWGGNAGRTWANKIADREND